MTEVSRLTDEASK